MPLDPIFVTPRLLPRSWGRADLGDWCAGAPRPPAPVGEIWPMHAGNVTAYDEHLGALLMRDPQAMLGDLGRAPPSLRLVLAGGAESRIASDAPVALWRVLESEADARLVVDGADRRGRARRLRCRPGDLYRASDHAQLGFEGNVTALEARVGFAPSNAPVAPAFLPLLAPKPRGERATWMRDAALSVELWRVAGESRLVPDGETCHVLLALSPGASIDGRALGKGEAVLLPAEGRAAILSGAGAQLLVAYPDLVPTSIWRNGPEPDRPAAARLQPPAPELADLIANAEVRARRAAM